MSSIGDYRPTDQSIEFKNEVTAKIDAELAKIYEVFDKELKKLNKMVKQSDISLISID